MKRALASKTAKTLHHALLPSTSEPSFREAVLQGLSQPEKSLPPKFFYDRIGSQLFEEITDLPGKLLPDAHRGGDPHRVRG